MINYFKLHATRQSVRCLKKIIVNKFISEVAI